MKLIKQQILFFKQGKSDKVYEVDLCEVEVDQYVVNFRYGRRGGTLKDGTKTVLPVDLEEAEKLYNNLVSGKMKKGYVENLEEREAPASSKPAAGDRRQYIINLVNKYMEQLKSGTYGEGSRKWPLGRVVWRAGELKIGEVEKPLIECLGRGSAMLDYSIVWALGHLHQDKNKVMQVLTGLYNTPATPAALKRITVEAMLKVMTGGQIEEFRRTLIPGLLKPLRSAINTTPEEFFELLKNNKELNGHKYFDNLYSLYQIDNAVIRPALIRLLETVPLEPQWFRPVRYIFKAAEYRGDSEVYSLLAYRFETTRCYYRKYWWGNRGYKGKYYRREEMKKRLEEGKPCVAFSNVTKLYLQNRVIRRLRRLGEIGEAGFIENACKYLAHITDEDGGKVRYSEHYSNLWRRDPVTRQHKSYKIYFDRFASKLIFNYILYHNSPRYMKKDANYCCLQEFKPGAPPPDVREEAFPELWDRDYRAIVPLLAKSRCDRVHQFGVKALSGNRAFLEAPTKEDALALLKSRYQVSAELGAVVTENLLKMQSPDSEIVLAMAFSLSSRARTMGFGLLQKQRDLVNADILFQMMFSPFGDAREFVGSFLDRYPLNENDLSALFGRIISNMVLIASPEKAVSGVLKEQLGDVSVLILKNFRSQCACLEERILLDLIHHKLQEIQELGGKILLIHNTYSENPPDKIIQMLLKSKFPTVMGLGVELFGKLPDDELAGKEQALKEFLLHPREEVRAMARPIISRLVAANDGFAEKFFTMLITHLFRLKDEEKIKVLVPIIREDFDGVGTLPMLIIWRMLRSRQTEIQELGGCFLDQTEERYKLPVPGIRELSGSEIRRVRETAWDLCEKNPEQLRENMETTVKMMDSRWDDTREFAFRFIQEHYKKEDFSPLSLVNICDSNRTDVQNFGRQLIMQYFEEKDGGEYLLKLSEHPAATIQFFVTGLLAKYAAGQPERIEQLADYMKRVLLSVNRAETAKARLLHFIKQEASVSEESARCLAPILTAVSGTIAVTYKARAVEIMCLIAEKYPDIPLPIKTVEPEVRHAI